MEALDATNAPDRLLIGGTRTKDGAQIVSAQDVVHRRDQGVEKNTFDQDLPHFVLLRRDHVDLRPVDPLSDKGLLQTLTNRDLIKDQLLCKPKPGHQKNTVTAVTVRLFLAASRVRQLVKVAGT